MTNIPMINDPYVCVFEPIIDLVMRLRNICIDRQRIILYQIKINKSERFNYRFINC